MENISKPVTIYEYWDIIIKAILASKGKKNSGGSTAAIVSTKGVST